MNIKRKKLISILLALGMVFTILPFRALADGVNVGDYVILGKYYDEPILWRCVDIENGAPLMLSDKILCIKPFDAAGEHPNDYNDQRLFGGSNLWATSNLRSWLNSAATAGKVQWLCGNPPTADKVSGGDNSYADEKGFLAEGNFSASERSIIKQVTQKSLLNYQDRDLAATGSTEHLYVLNISGVLGNYSAAYANNVTDRMFLLDVAQVYQVYANRGVLGDSYYLGQPTTQCVENSELINAPISTGNNWLYWLRSPIANDSYPAFVRYVNSDDYVYNAGANSGFLGVRPAFFINLSSVIFISGDGSIDDPYVIGGDGSGSSIPGDINGDGKVDATDLSILIANFGKTL